MTSKVSLPETLQSIEHYRSITNQKLIQLKILQAQLKSNKLVLTQSEQRLLDTQQARSLVQEVAESIQEKAHQRISSVVTKCLQTIFGESAYEFKIKFIQRRGKTEAELVFVTPQGDELDPTEASGGGVIDVASFALRLSCLVLTRPRKRLLLLLDEPFKHLSRDKRPKVCQLLEELSKELDLQIIMVTHAEELITGDVVEL